MPYLLALTTFPSTEAPVKLNSPPCYAPNVTSHIPQIGHTGQCRLLHVRTTCTLVARLRFPTNPLLGICSDPIVPPTAHTLLIHQGAKRAHRMLASTARSTTSTASIRTSPPAIGPTEAPAHRPILAPLSCPLLSSPVLRSLVPSWLLLCCAELCCTVLCCAVLCCADLASALLSSSALPHSLACRARWRAQTSVEEPTSATSTQLAKPQIVDGDVHIQTQIQIVDGVGIKVGMGGKISMPFEHGIAYDKFAVCGYCGSGYCGKHLCTFMVSPLC